MQQNQVMAAKELSEKEINTLAQAGVIPQGTPPAILRVFATACHQHGLSPFKKEIYLVGYGGKYSTIVGIDGLRAKADRTGQLAGRDDAKFDLMPDGTFKTAAQLVSERKRPTTCTVTVYRAIGGMRCPFTKTVLFAEYCPANNSGNWRTMPFNMIEKCAEAHALRMGFASETAGLNIEEEAAAIQDMTISAAKSSSNKNEPAQVASVELHPDSILEIESCQTIDALKSLWEQRKNQFIGPAKDAYKAKLVSRQSELQNATN